ncbi:MAG: molybdenum cofactor biosynthesis protein MoaE [Pirellulaceae bacterium]
MIELTYNPIDISRLLEVVSNPACGAEVLFVGTTRQWTSHPHASGDRTVETSHLVYEAYEEMAISQLQALADQARSQWPVQAVAIVHRLGKVLPMEASVAIAVGCPHRAEAFEAAQWLIDSIKHDVPIWKQEHYVQPAGATPVSAEWIHPTSGSCHCESEHTDQISQLPQQAPRLQRETKSTQSQQMQQQ